MRGGRWKYNNEDDWKWMNSIDHVATDAEVVRRFPKLAACLAALQARLDGVGEVYRAVTHDLDRDLSGDHFIGDGGERSEALDAAFEEQAIRDLEDNAGVPLTMDPTLVITCVFCGGTWQLTLPPPAGAPVTHVLPDAFRVALAEILVADMQRAREHWCKEHVAVCTGVKR